MVTIATESKPTRKTSTQDKPYFSLEEFYAIAEELPDRRVELLNGKLAADSHFTLAEFNTIAELLPYRRLELIKGEIKVFPPPDKEHQYLASHFVMLCAQHSTEIEALGCFLAGSTNYFEVPESFLNEEGAGPSNINPDATICYRDYWYTNRRPPALLMVEVLSFSNREVADNDLVTKLAIYAALGIPAYWIIDRRDQSVWAHTQLRDGEYKSHQQLKADEVLFAPGLEFLQITPAQIFAR